MLAIHPAEDGTCSITVDCQECRSVVMFTGCFPIAHDYDVIRSAVEGALNIENMGKLAVSVPRGEPHELEFCYEPFTIPEDDDDGSEADS